MKGIVALLITLLIAQVSLAQYSEFLPGYLIMNSGDTVKGFIQRSTTVRSYDSCFFKSQPEEKPVIFYPSQLKSYQVDGNSLMVTRSIQLKKEAKLVFLERLVGGRASLFLYRGYRESQFFVEKESSFELLTNETVKVKTGETFVYRKNNSFVTVLSKLLSDCDKVTGDVKHAKLLEKSLTKLIEKYNQCVGSSPSTRSKGKSIAAHFGIFGGFVSSNHRVQEDYIPNLATNFHFFGPYRATTYGVGGFIELTLIRKGFGSAFRMDIIYSNLHYTGSRTDTYTYTSTIDASQLKLPVTYKYIFTPWKVAPYLLAGMYLSIPFNVTSELSMKSNSPFFTDQYYKDIVPMHAVVGLVGGVGFNAPVSEKMRLFLEGRFGLASGTKTYEVFAGVRF